MLGGGVNVLAIVRQRDAVGTTVPLRCNFMRLASGQIHRHQSEAIGLEAGALHRPVVQGFAIGGKHRAGIPRLVGGSQIARIFAIGIHQPDIEIGTPRFFAVGLAHAHRHLLAIRRPRKIRQITKWLGGNIASDITTEQGGRGQLALAAQLGRKHAVQAPIGPGIPVPNEHVVKHYTGVFLGRNGIQFFLGAGQIGLALGEHRKRQRHLLAIRRELVAIHIQCKIGQLACLTAAQCDGIQLHRAGLATHEVKRLAVL